MRLERVTGTGIGAGTGKPLHKCIALAIDAVSGSFACSIYERRPQVCRDLQRSSSACRGELSTKSDRPKRALSVLRESEPA
jgi:Fe-S-cluster containining protein